MPPVKKPAHETSQLQVPISSIKTANGVVVEVYDKFYAEDVCALLGLVDLADPGCPKADKRPAVTYKYRRADGSKGEFCLLKNAANRSVSLGLARQYSAQLLRQEWAGQEASPSRTGNGESLVTGSDGQAISLAHRGIGLFLAEQERQWHIVCGREDVPQEPLYMVDVIVAKNVDPAAADTSDTGKGRTQGDVFFRKNLFTHKDYKPADYKKLADALAVAVRLVWLRTTGRKVKNGPKLFHPEAEEFRKRHPLLLKAVEFVYNENKGTDTHKRPIDKFGFSVGYVAAHIYLAAMKEYNLGKYHSENATIERKPSAALWDKAEEFWTLFSQIGDALLIKNAPPAIAACYQVLQAVKGEGGVKQVNLDRDGQCTVVTRAMLSYLENEKTGTSPAALRKGLINTKGEDGWSPEFERFGGLDVDRGVLTELALVDDEELVRKQVEGWKVGETAWVDFGSYQEKGKTKYYYPGFGTIKELSDDGTQAIIVMSKDIEGYDEGDEMTVGIGQLCTDKPEYQEEEEEETSEAA